MNLTNSKTSSLVIRRWDRNRLDRTFKGAILHANINAAIFYHDHVDMHHILLALVDQTGSAAWEIMQACGVEYKDFYSKLAILDPMRPPRKINKKLPLTPDATKAIYLAIEEAQSFRRKIIDSNHLFLGILRVNSGITRRILESLGVDCLTTYRSIRAKGTKKV